jgi:acetyltransferase-like isoleucine patch superfamily enzyme
MPRKLILPLIAVMPFNRLRIFLYRLLAGYRISYDSRIGWFNFIDVKEAQIIEGRIGHFNIIRCRTLKMSPGSRIDKFNHVKNPHTITLGKNSIIGTRNHFVGTRPGLTPFKEYENIIIGQETIITVGHLFDLSDTITLGDNITFGGRGTEVWTHGFDLNHVKIQAPVIIGDDVYVGSRCMIIQGVEICGHVSLGAGTVVPKSIVEPGFYVSSQLFKKAHATDYSTAENIIEYKNARFVRK